MLLENGPVFVAGLPVVVLDPVGRATEKRVWLSPLPLSAGSEVPLLGYEIVLRSDPTESLAVGNFG